MDLETKSLFTRSGYCTLFSSDLVAKRYAKLFKTWVFLGFLVAFPNSYMVEAGLSLIDALLTKQ